MMKQFLALTATLLGLAACASETAAPTGPASPPSFASANESELHFLTVAETAPDLAGRSVSFYAVRGQDTEASIWYHPHPGAPDSTRLARFRVRKESLVNDVAGDPIAVGDSILITMRVADPDHQVVEFEPSGLLFSRKKPADLTLWYLETDHDFNRDGVIDRADSVLERSFQIWRQEQPGDPYESQTTQLSTNTDQAEAEVPGFTRYVVAY